MHHPFPPYQQQQYHQCPSDGLQAQAYDTTQQSYYYPQHDQNLYQYGEGYEYGTPSLQPGMPVPVNDYQTSILSRWFNFSDPCYLKGLLVGAGLTFLLTNSTVQRAIVRGTVNLMSVVQGSVEEVKEQIKDIKAEMSQKPEE